MKRYDIDFGCYEESSKPQDYEVAVMEDKAGEWVRYEDVKELIEICKHVQSDLEVAANRRTNITLFFASYQKLKKFLDILDSTN